MKPLPLYLLTICFLSFNATAQKHKKPPKNSNAETEQEVKAFFKTYAEHLVQNHKEAIADLYDPSGCYILGNANKSFLSFEENKKYYLTRWTAPKSFEWNDLSIEIISPSAVVATAIFNLERSTGEKMTYSYTGLLIKQSGKWRIRVEDESFNSIGYSTKTISGDRLAPGPFRYLLTARPGASIAAHLHSADMQIKVVSGSKFIIMGDLDHSTAQRFDAGTSFTIPANTWHVEWWEDETVEEIEIIAPFQTQRATPSTPRTSIDK